MHSLVATVAISGVLACFASAPAHADPSAGGVLVRAIELRPQHDVAISDGAGVDVALVPWQGIREEDCPSGCIETPYVNPLYLGVGAFGTVSRGDATQVRRDLYGVRVTAGGGWGPKPWLLGFVACDLDALDVQTNLPGGGHHGGPTLGADVRVGLLGQLGERFMYMVDASYLGAVAPGVGDNAGGLAIEIGVGWRFWQPDKFF